MDPSFRIRGHELRSDSFLRLGQAGDKETRKSSSAGIALVGRHQLKTFSSRRSSSETVRKQNCLQRHWERQKRKGSRAVMCDLDFAVEPVLIIDAKATEHILHRHGIGKNETPRRGAFVVGR